MPSKAGALKTASGRRRVSGFRYGDAPATPVRQRGPRPGEAAAGFAVPRQPVSRTTKTTPKRKTKGGVIVPRKVTRAPRRSGGGIALTLPRFGSQTPSRPTGIVPSSRVRKRKVR